MKKWVAVLLSVMLCLATFTASAHFSFVGLLSVNDENLVYVSYGTDKNNRINSMMLNDENLGSLTKAMCRWDILEDRLAPDEDWSGYYELVKADLEANMFDASLLPLKYSDVSGDGEIRWMLITGTSGKDILVLMEGSGYVLYEGDKKSIPASYGEELASKATVLSNYHPLAKAFGQTLMIEVPDGHVVSVMDDMFMLSPIGTGGPILAGFEESLEINFAEVETKITNGIVWFTDPKYGYTYLKDGDKYVMFQLADPAFDLEAFINDCMFLKPVQ